MTWLPDSSSVFVHARPNPALEADWWVVPLDGRSPVTLAEVVMPAYLPGTAPVATPDQIILVLGDIRGDVWLMDLDPA